ncbi:hypothetical protein TELCIR_06492 [Teladorsagia circumcincta]|uniref:Uncharacterized protein n=1 Tax=Teladorsagia circumcincta TaxID=45464 RepID=A0A2G9UN76_TELCI|nr:hypothetical protein TELCIR_06492 [Teladorsagia circumcincta]
MNIGARLMLQLQNQGLRGFGLFVRCLLRLNNANVFAGFMLQLENQDVHRNAWKAYHQRVAVAVTAMKR